MTENGITTGDDALVLALATGVSVREAAARSGLSERTAYRHLEDPGMRRRVNEARTRLFDETLGLLASASASAVETLRGLLSDGSPMVRLGASRAILEHSARLRESCEMESRMRETEQ